MIQRVLIKSGGELVIFHVVVVIIQDELIIPQIDSIHGGIDSGLGKLRALNKTPT